MTILFLDQYSDPGGAQQCLADLLPAIAAKSWQAVVLAPGEGWLQQRAIEAGAQYRPIAYGPFHSGRKSLADALRLFRQAAAVKREITAIPADLIYVNGPRLLPAIPPGRPVIFHCHSYLNASALWLAKKAIRRTRARLIGACRFVLRPLGKGDVVYNGVAPQPSHRAQAIFHVGMIGRIAPQKGQLELLRAARHLPDIKFTICGAPLFSDATYADQLRAEAQGVEFLPWQQNPGEILATFDLLVVPSTIPEATPRVILEAFAAGVPVLASNSGGIPELIEHNRTGFLIDSLDPAALAQQISSIADQPELRATVSANAHAAWQARLTLSEYQRRILSICDSTVQRRAPSPA